MPLAQWTIECRANVDEETSKIVREVMETAAVRIQANLALLCPAGNPEAVVFSSDFFTGVEEIQAVAKQIPPDAVKGDADEGVSKELIDALRDHQGG